MKKIFFFVFSFFIISLMATTFTSPTLEGVIDTITPVSWGHYEDFETEIFDAADYSLWITWDEDNLYAGIDRVDGDTDNRFLGDNEGNLSFFVAIDTDQIPGSGATSDGYGRVTFSGSYLPEHCFYFTGGGGWAEWSTWDGSAWTWNGWTDDWGYYGWNNTGNYDDELQISWARLGNPTGIVFKAWITGEGDGSVLASWPYENPVGVSPDLPWGYQFYSPHMSPVNGNLPLAGVHPNVTEHSVPVYLSSFYVTYINDIPIINWVTQSESDNIGWNVYRSISYNFGQAEMLNLNTIPGNGTTSEPSFYSFTDEYGVYENSTYWYWVESISSSGETESFGPVSLFIPENEDNGTPVTPDDYGLQQNYPNPFNPSTTISFALEEESDVEITIYNVKGEKIKTIFSAHIIEDQVQTAIWDGLDVTGKQVSSGVYLYKMKTDNNEETRKMILMK